VVRTLTGHRSNVISVDFHPFGEFFASGSLDCNTKIWDIRRKGCIHTYKGHDRGVSVTKFSPDGKWVLSGGQDGRIKLWDLTAGKLLKELPAHDGPVTSVEFHPNELLVATRQRGSHGEVLGPRDVRPGGYHRRSYWGTVHAVHTRGATRC